MNVTSENIITGVKSTIDLPVTQEQMDEWNNPNRTRHVQEIFPNLTADQREFLISGIKPGEWDSMFPPEDEDDDYFEEGEY